MLLHQKVLNGLHVFLIERLIAGYRQVRTKQLVCGRLFMETFRPYTRKQHREKIRAIRGKFENGLVHHEFQHVLPPDIGDEGNSRLKRNDIRKVLFRADPHVDAARPGCRLEGGNHILILKFVR